MISNKKSDDFKLNDKANDKHFRNRIENRSYIAKSQRIVLNSNK